MAVDALMPPPSARTAAPAADTAGPEAVRHVALYAKRKKIYQREVQGPFQTLRAGLLFLLAGLYLVLPWINWHGRQAVWFDLPQRKFHLFHVTFWPQDFIFLSWLLIIGAISLLFFTNLAGRLWCGYACPQTVWTKVFMWIEWLTEGNRNERMRLDKAPWSPTKIARKSAKQGLWILTAVVVNFTFVGYFTPMRDLAARFVFAWSTTELVAVAFGTVLLYVFAAWMREQICLYACPYARFQGAMFDPSTLTVFYDRTRGEPRGHRPKRADPRAAGLGDCVACNLCVDVCPTGIDIRNGTQYECINCAACIDACNSVMDKVGYAHGLVRYATEEGLAGKPYRLLRPRLLGYGTVLAVMIGAFTYGISHRVPLELDILRDRARLYRITNEGLIENVYLLKIMNMDERPHTYRITADGVDGLRLVGPEELEVASGEIREVPVRLQVASGVVAQRSLPVRFTVQADDDDRIATTEQSRFIQPPRAAG